MVICFSICNENQMKVLVALFFCLFVLGAELNNEEAGLENGAENAKLFQPPTRQLAVRIC